MAKEDPEMIVLTRYAARQITRARAAKMLKCSERQLTRKMVDKGLERTQSERSARRERTQQMRDIRAEAAAQAARGRISVQQAAARAGCAERTIYRLIAATKPARARKGRKRS